MEPLGSLLPALCTDSNEARILGSGQEDPSSLTQKGVHLERNKPAHV